MRGKLLLFGILMANLIYSQKHDYNWPTGQIKLYPDSVQCDYCGNAITHFEEDTFTSYVQPLNISFSFYVSSLSDVWGNPLMFTNGKKIVNHQGQVIENGDSINYGPWWEGNSERYGYSAIPGAYFLPVYNDSNTFIFTHIFIEDVYPDDSLVSYLMYSKIHRESDGHLKVVNKNVIVSPVIARGGNMSVVQHGNGRDWWIVMEEYRTNCYHKFILEADSIRPHSVQCLGYIDTIPDAGILRFNWGGG